MGAVLQKHHTLSTALLMHHLCRSVRSLRVLRSFRVLRVMKMFKYLESLKMIAAVRLPMGACAGPNMQTVTWTLEACGTVRASIAMYYSTTNDYYCACSRSSKMPCSPSHVRTDLPAYTCLFACTCRC
jgi:hypothetical protein